MRNFVMPDLVTIDAEARRCGEEIRELMFRHVEAAMRAETKRLEEQAAKLLAEGWSVADLRIACWPDGRKTVEVLERLGGCNATAFSQGNGRDVTVGT